MNFIFVDIDGVLNHWNHSAVGGPWPDDPEDWQTQQIAAEGLKIPVHTSPTVIKELEGLIDKLALHPVWATTWINFPKHLYKFSRACGPTGSAQWDRINRIEYNGTEIGSGKLPGILTYLETFAQNGGKIDTVVVVDDMFTPEETARLGASSIVITPEWFLTGPHIKSIEEQLI